MANRGTGGQMDFEYNNQTGPVDQQSAFLKSIQQHLPQAQTDNLAKKRPFSAYNSPNKNSDFASLRSPTSSHSLFSAPPAHANPAFTTPRASHEMEIPSSGAETSPDNNNNADSEATPDTPDMAFKSSLSKANTTMRTFWANQARPDTGSPMAKRQAVGAPGKGDLIRSSHSTGIAKRMARSRQKNSEKRLFRRKNSSSSDSFDDDTHNRSSQDRKTSGGGIGGTVAGIFTFIEHHPALPHILSFYAQLLLNVFLVVFFIYLIYSFWATIKADVDKKADEAAADVLAAIAACTAEYLANGCDAPKRAPALENPCANWRRCMDRDASSVGRARVSAHTFAEIFNSFIEPISVKAMAFSLVLAVGCFAVSNLAFGLFRNKVAAQQPRPPTPWHAPPTPAHSQMQQEFYWTPSAQQQQWQASPMRRGVEQGVGFEGLDAQTPRRRLAYL